MRHSLIPMYREMHGQAHFCGRSVYAYVDDIAKLVAESGTQTLLDYGSGKGRQYIEGRIHELWGGIMPTLYDPAVEGIDTRPVGKFDGVICTDVMEHIPEDELDETLEDIRDHARMWVFLSICCEPAKKNLPNGKNVHITLRPEEWWLELLLNAFHGDPKVHVRFDRPAVGKPKTAKKMKEEWVKRGWKRAAT